MSKHPKVSPTEMMQMLELYNSYGTYAAVARKMRRHPDTVSKYVRLAIAAQGSASREEVVEETEKTIIIKITK